MRNSPAPNRSQRPQQRKALLKQANRLPRTDSPSHLPISAIQQAPSLFQPRFDSIAYAPGRSEGHVAGLARVAQKGAELDPVKVVAFGNDWYLVDGHHRLEAYREAEWTKPIPVEVRHSELKGDARIGWAIQESVEDNKKNRLAMSETDKMDAAWAAVARGDELSVHETSVLYDVSKRTVANMRQAVKTLREAEVPLEQVVSWQRAKNEVRRLAAGPDGSGDYDPDDKKRREAARRLKGVMEMHLPPRLLADVLENYEPGIVDMMALALKIRREEDDDDMPTEADPLDL